jgi:TfoX/Sxy family transcriptional regulator of competence genes
MFFDFITRGFEMQAVPGRSAGRQEGCRSALLFPGGYRMMAKKAGRAQREADAAAEEWCCMPSSRSYLDFVLDQLSGLEGVTWRAMMGEFILYYRGRVFGGIYDDRLLVKPTASALALMPDAPRELPYEGAKEMLLADVDRRDLLRQTVQAIADDLPAPKKRAK